MSIYLYIQQIPLKVKGYCIVLYCIVLYCIVLYCIVYVIFSINFYLMFASVPVAGGRSRLHLVDLGSCSKGKDGKALSLQALGNVLWALLNGQRHVPYRYDMWSHAIPVCH